MLMSNTMKIQIRKSVFETNSSSVHTLTITKNSISKERFPIGNKTMDEMFHFILNKYNKL